MTATELTSQEVLARLRRRLLLHEAAHAVASWLQGGEVLALSADGWTYSLDPEPAMRAVVYLAGPALDSVELDWLTEAHLDRPEVKASNQRAARVSLVISPWDDREDDWGKARQQLSKLKGDPQRLYRRAWAIASDLVAGSDTSLLIGHVADALDETGELDAEAFVAVAEPFHALRQMYLFAAPWMDLGPLTTPSELPRSAQGDGHAYLTEARCGTGSCVTRPL